MKTFHKAPGDRIGEYELDANDSFVMTAELANGALGTDPGDALGDRQRSTSSVLTLYGDKGALRRPHRRQGLVAAMCCAGPDIDTQTWREVEVPAGADDLPALRRRGARRGVNGDPDFRRGAALQRVLDLCFTANGLGIAEGRVALNRRASGNTRCRKTTPAPKNPPVPARVGGSRIADPLYIRQTRGRRAVCAAVA